MRAEKIFGLRPLPHPAGHDRQNKSRFGAPKAQLFNWLRLILQQKRKPLANRYSWEYHLTRLIDILIPNGGRVTFSAKPCQVTKGQRPIFPDRALFLLQK